MEKSPNDSLPGTYLMEAPQRKLFTHLLMMPPKPPKPNKSTRAMEVDMVMTPSVVSGSAVDCVMVGLGFGNAHPPVGNALMTHLSQFVLSSGMVTPFHFNLCFVSREFHSSTDVPAVRS